jgi:hypothetical protein
MEFASADPSVVKSIRQRYLLNEWLRAAAKRRPMPLLRDFQLDRVDDEMADMMGYDVVGEGDGARFLITQQPDEPEAESRAGDSGQGDRRSRFRAGFGRPAFFRRSYRPRLGLLD